MHKTRYTLTHLLLHQAVVYGNTCHLNLISWSFCRKTRILFTQTKCNGTQSTKMNNVMTCSIIAVGVVFGRRVSSEQRCVSPPRASRNHENKRRPSTVAITHYIPPIGADDNRRCFDDVTDSLLGEFDYKITRFGRA